MLNNKSAKNVLQFNNFYPLLIFISAFLLFQIQPMISRYILPWFGGSSNVWIISVLFFQTFLLAGYAYAHFLIRFFRPAFQISFYLFLLFIAVLILPITPADYWKDYILENPTLTILSLLIISIGLPYFILSATSPLIQAWFNQQFPNASPYRLYSLSNFGSLLGLVTYPFIIEPFFNIRLQTQIWSAGFIFFVVLVVILTFQKSNKFFTREAWLDKKDIESKSPLLYQRLLWIVLPFLASGMLLAVTNYITQDIAAVPLLWIFPLVIYLFSFIFTFRGSEFYDRRLVVKFFILIHIILAVLLKQGFADSIIMIVIAFLLSLLFYTIFCHGELFELKPDPKYLTSFYLAISLGGALGGIFVGLISPLIFPAYLELHFFIFVGYLLLIIILLINRSFFLYPKYPIRSWFFILIFFIFISYILGSQVVNTVKKPWFISRDFYGVIRLFKQQTGESGHYISLYHGGILHGSQFSLPENECYPTTYYGYESGVGKSFDLLKNRGNLKIGAVGLGTGTLASYAADSYIRFYEISSNVAMVAQKQFTYLNKCAGSYDIILGDARISLEKESPQNFDIMVLDAFSGDAIPVHLMTKESFAVYLNHLKPNGILAVHISNKYVNLEPVVSSLAGHFNLSAVIIKSESAADKAQAASTWVILSPDSDLLKNETIKSVAIDFPVDLFSSNLWTDNYSNILRVLRFW